MSYELFNEAVKTFNSLSVIREWENQSRPCEARGPWSLALKSSGRVLTCPLSSDAILLLLILHYSGSLQQSLLYTLVYPSTALLHFLISDHWRKSMTPRPFADFATSRVIALT